MLYDITMSHLLKEKTHMTELTTIDPNNYGAMAKAMGIANEAPANLRAVLWLDYA